MDRGGRTGTAIVQRLWMGLATPRDDKNPVSERQLWLVYGAAAASLLIHLFHQYRSEEAVYVLVAQEMREAQNFLVPTLFGRVYGRPGLFSWLIYGVAEVIGWEHVRLVARLLAVAATAVTGLVLAWLVQRLFHDRRTAALAAAAYLSGDVLIARGWLGYSDPLFALLTFAAIACLWVATAGRRTGLLAVAALCLIGSFLTKVSTGYVFYGVMGLLLLWRHPNRWFLVSPRSLLLHALALGFPLAWNFYVDPSILRVLVAHVSMHAQEGGGGLVARLTDMALFPLRVMWHLLPATGVYVYCLYRRAVPFNNADIVIASLFLIVNLIPYWLGSGFSARYLMPLYPVFALVISHGIAGSGEWAVALLRRLLWLAIGVNIVVAAVDYAYWERAKNGDQRAAANVIVARAGDAPLYAADDTAGGLSLSAEVNTLRPGKPPLRRPPADWQGFAIAWKPSQVAGVEIAEQLVLGRQVRYLLCRGPVCAAAPKR
jgi:4-amino-4-deoxy-L-arabinose transferase-like glycosyltransferase